LLKVQNVDSFYGDMQVLRQVSLNVNQGEIVALFGPNGHGKSTLLKAISGLHPPTAGSVAFQRQEISNLPAHKIVEMGMAYIPEQRHLFRDMTVLENLRLGAYNIRARDKIAENLEFVYQMFPRLAERKTQLCSTLSGGESRMVAIARGLMSGATLLLVDEPSIGLAPSLKMAVFEAIQKINQEANITIFIIEQEIEYSLEISDRIYLMKKGEIAFERRISDVDVKEIKEAYF
jgi:branched-chain amino acid transport system ATP-binding protein